MTEAAPPEVKRRRLSTANTSPQGIRCIIDLPSGILAHAASFLAPPSRALFAVALDENSAITPIERSSAIVGNHWDTLDFGDIEKELAKKLTDLEIKRLLLYIDAVNNVKRLKLTNCTNITGTCLEPLRGSVVIEQIDLSLVRNESPDLDPEPPISCEHVLPILDSITEREGCALVHLLFPSVWKKEPSTDSELHAFIVRYNEMRGSREITCLKCNDILPSGDEWIKTDTEYGYFGTHWNTCYACLKNYCYDCDNDEVLLTNILHDCTICKRDYCKDCSEMAHCSGCVENICSDCCKYDCVKCNEEFCLDCVQNGNRIDKCEYCDQFCCRGCCGDEVADIIHTCSRCDIKCCDDCRLHRFRQGQQHCTDCIKQIAHLLVGESLERKHLQDENKQLKFEMEELKRQIEELKLENEELRSKLT